MTLVKIKQITGLQAALDLKIETASNQGSGNQGIFKSVVGTDLGFFRLSTSSSVVAGSPISDIIPLDLDISNISTEITSTQGTDRIALMDDDAADITGFITLTNLGNSMSVPVKLGDYTLDTSVGTDHIRFFDATDSDNTNIETKDDFLQLYALLHDSDFTVTHTAPTASAVTNNS